VQSETIDLDSRQHTPWRKEFDVIIASHSILPLDEDYLRRDHVRNLWLMLNPKGGVLILVEKGRSNGFEAIAGAREMILNRLISSPGSTQYENILGNAEEEIIDKEKGMIIAPCTNHSQCPLHVSTKDGRRPAWHCHFSQRYIRPPYLQRILGASDRNNEDVLFSYLAVQRGVDQREVRGLTQDAAATDVAFTGYGGDSIHGGKVPEEPPAGFDPLALPRIVSAPLKKKGHIIMDMCTPAGKMERWIVPRSFGKRAYRDARKSSWGDLWALGAKTRLHREVIRQKTPRAQKSEQDEDSANDLESEAVPGLVGARDLKGLSKYRKKVAKGKLKKAGRAAAQRPTDGSLEYDG
jgi:ribosomal protein RSM22 (predicted rRNA methylase)